MYRIAVLTDLKHEGEHYAKVINDYCINQKLFPLLETYQNQEVFFKEIQTHVPDIVLLVLPGVDGLNAAEHLRSLFPGCGIIWCSNLDFSLHAFRLRVSIKCTPEYEWLEKLSKNAPILVGIINIFSNSSTETWWCTYSILEKNSLFIKF